jgi:flagellar motor protein MotB
MATINQQLRDETASGFASLFLSSEERQELRELEQDYSDADKQEKREIRKRVKELRQQQLEAVKIITDADKSGSLRGWFEGILNTKPKDDQYLSVKSDEQLRADFNALDEFHNNFDQYEAAWLFAQNAPKLRGDAYQDDFREAAYNSIIDLAGEVGIGEMEEILADEETLTKLVDTYYNEGFNQFDNRSKFKRFLLDEYGQNILGNTGASLRGLATAYGINHDDAWFDSAERRVLGGEATLDSYEDIFREQSGLLYPQFENQIAGGQNVWDLVAPWRQVTQELLEYVPTSLNDPHLQYAMQAMNGEDGMPGNMSIMDYKRYLREQPEWLGTDNGRKTVDSQMINLAEMFGIM